MRKSPLIIIGLLAAFSIEANAGELYYQEQYQLPFVSTQTRADVHAATLRALAAKQVAFGEVDLPTSSATQGSLSRADVRLEARQALAAHAIAFGEAVQTPVAADATPRTRSEVRAEFTQAMTANARMQPRDLQGY